MKSKHHSGGLSTRLFKRAGFFVLVSAGIMTVSGASAFSFHNPGSKVSSGNAPFILSCSFDEYGNVGTYSVPIQIEAVPKQQTFSFNGENVDRNDGGLTGYTYTNNDSRREWRMETGLPGSPIYRFTHFKETGVVIANVDIVQGRINSTIVHDSTSRPAQMLAEVEALMGQNEPAPAHASSDIKAAHALKTSMLADVHNAAQEALAMGEADEQAQSDNGHDEIPDIHSIKGICHRSVS